jgi:hypothetical protein
MPLMLLPGVILAEGTGKSQLADAGTAREPGMNIIGLCLTGILVLVLGKEGGVAGILVPVPILVQESFGTGIGMGTNTKFGKSTGDWYLYQNCHNSYVLVTV